MVEQPSRPPRKIKPLPKDVVDRIAAGEVVQRPISVVKELIENSLDADASQIDIQISHGGLDSIIVSDDGVGISPFDLPLACTRFATSKLVHVDDLKSIRTFGFRGEALASASMVAHVCITSRVRSSSTAFSSLEVMTEKDDVLPSVKNNVTNDTVINDKNSKQQQQNYQSSCAYKMYYNDGEPDSKLNSNNNKPQPSAGCEGTVITVRDLFYNVPSRRRAFENSTGKTARSEREEYDRILGVAQRYAVHVAQRGVSLLCRGGGSSSSSGGGGGGGKSKVGGGGGSRFGKGNSTDLNTQSLASVRLIQERRKRARQTPPATVTTTMSDASSTMVAFASTTVEEQFAATKDVIGHIFGTDVTRELLPIMVGEGDVEAVGLAALAAMVRHKSGGDELSSSSSMTIDGLDNMNASDKQICNSNENSTYTNNLLEEMMMGGGVIDMPHRDKNNDDSSNDVDRQQLPTAQSSKFAFAYRAKGVITNGSYSAPKSSSAFLLFINDRLIESSSIRRAVESVYADTLPKGGKPFIYLSLELPGPHIDVNVHPTKREVALLHEDRLCDALSKAVRDVIGSATTSRAFSVANGGRLLPREENDDVRKRSQLLIRKRTAVESVPLENEMDTTNITEEEPNAVDTHQECNASTIINNHNDEPNTAAQMTNSIGPDRIKAPLKREAVVEVNKSATKRPYDPSRLVRTSRSFPVGALEPFLVQKETKASRNIGGGGGVTASPLGDGTNQTNQVAASTSSVIHKPECPLYNDNNPQQVDMSIPGAFALAICRCQIVRSESLPPLTTTNNFVTMNNINDNTMARPKKITPTQCDYESISNLRDEIVNLNDQGLNEMLRGSTFVGAVSRCRSLIQSGIDLMMINHRELAREVFYQIALLKFGGMTMAKLGGGGVDVVSAISQMLQFEEELTSSLAANNETINARSVIVNKLNSDMARQASTCLAEKAPMLKEYFSIKLEKVKVYNSSRQNQQVESLRITGLPVLLEGHSPQPHGLPLFLLRLATEVNWLEEQECFKDICTELAFFYSELPSTPLPSKEASSDNNTQPRMNDVAGSRDNYDFIGYEAKYYVKHTVFPAISYLLMPPKRFNENGAVIKLANLNSLYKVFERC